LKTNRLGAVDWIHLADDGDQFLSLLNVDYGFRLLNILWLSSTSNSYYRYVFCTLHCDTVM